MTTPQIAPSEIVPLKILLLGGGGREHALAVKLATSPLCAKLLAAPGNPGIAEVAEIVASLSITSPEAVARFATGNKIDFVVVGPEAPLAAGVVDALKAAGIPCFGPEKAAARLEASKNFTKELCEEAHIPTAGWAHFTDAKTALAYAEKQPLPVVVKADGLAGGKGVTIARSHAEAAAAIHALFEKPGAEVVIEEFLAGEEVSFFVLSDGETACPLLSAQDHKAVGDGDTGPNTGGMGAYAPASVFTPALQKETMERIVQPTLKAMQQRGTPFRGVLFVGLMLTATGPRLLEYNVRFGDPECEALMPLLESDLVALLYASATGTLKGVTPRWHAGAAATVILAARGYPEAPRKGGAISGLEAAAKRGARVFQAGTRLEGGKLVASGGRVLAISATGKNVQEAVGLCYEALSEIDYADGFSRQDIGWREMARTGKEERT